MEALSDPQIAWLLVVFLVAIEAYATAATVIMHGFGLIPDGYAWYVFWAEFLGSMFHSSKAKDSELKELKKRVKRLEKRRDEQVV
jgi:hypothetical protein